MSIRDVALRWVQAKEDVERLNDELELAKSVRTQCAEQLLELMDDEGVESFKAAGFTLSPRRDFRVSVPSQHREEVKAWLRERGLESVITIQHKSFESLIRGYVTTENGRELDLVPEELQDKISTFEQLSLSARKSS